MANIDLSNMNVASVENGKLVDDYSKSSSTSTSSGTEMGYEQFLTLLCAEMQYQDPLEPTSNTEYVAQLASFSQLEATLSMKDTTTSMQETLQNSLTDTQKTLETNMANSLVGKYVILAQTDSSTGEQTYVDGKVDYVMYDDDGSVLISVNDGLYPLSSLDTIADSDYYEAVGLAKTMENMLGQLPDLEELDASYAKAVGQIRELYDGMTSYQQSHVGTDNVTKLESYEQKIAELTETDETDSTTEDVVEEATGVAEEIETA
jgi:flagellar basal-body rod modification protein FlgD